MTETFLADDTWIVNQLIGIKILEKELGSAVSVGEGHTAALRERVAALNSWLDLLDHALNANQEARMRARRRIAASARN